MRRVSRCLVLLLFVALTANASVSVKRSVDKPKTLDVAIVDEPLSSAVKALAMHLPQRVQLLVSEDRKITYSAKRVEPEVALRAVVSAADATLVSERGQLWIRNDREDAVTLDVKDAEVRVILKDMQKQCRIKNLVIDPQVQGSGTFLFDRVPCRTAFSVVFRTMGLASVDYGNSVLTVGVRR